MQHCCVFVYCIYLPRRLQFPLFFYFTIAYIVLVLIISNPIGRIFEINRLRSAFVGLV